MLLDVKNIVTTFDVEGHVLTALQDVSFHIDQGETLGIVGESGCGKSVTSLSVMGLLPKPSGKTISGSVLFKGENLLNYSPEQMASIRGRKMAMIFQEPMTALNPVYRIGRQIGEVFKIHFPEMKDQEILEKSIGLLEKVGIPAPDKRISEYPHQLSGGMRQRVMIAMALACEPELLICDEPTTALDVTIQAQILDLIKELQKKNNMAVIMITHDLGVIAEFCERVTVMYAGKVVESGHVKEIFVKPKHPYTKGLLASIPTLTKKRKTKLETIKGQVPSLMNMPDHCRFENRCPYAEEICRTKQLVDEEVSEEQIVSCHRWRDI
ncbi:MAG: ABC transporter ATP-binding protein [Lentisphaeraceae bacterium]|nr:ABC transporter ATP-binding protein [Lentisphaeraceae bacterium]